MDKVFLSIVTPIFNRVDLIDRVYESLLKQSVKCFEWIIIDDGSTDGSFDRCLSYQNDRFNIIVIKQENQGKHVALNTSHSYIHGLVTLIVDSDDYLLPNAVEIITKTWKQYWRAKNLGSITFLRGTDEKTPFCIAKKENCLLNGLKNNISIIKSVDCCQTIRSELFKKYRFPVFEGEKFLGESALWARLFIDYKVVFINKVLYICEYLEDGLTKKGRSLRNKNPKGGLFISEIRMNPKSPLKIRVKNAILFHWYGRLCGYNFWKLYSITSYKTWFLLSFPIAKLLSFKWAKKLDV